MALVPATITVNFTAQYVGPHRVCFRIVGAPSYTCTVPGGPGPGFHPICSGGGLPCSYDIDIMVDNETCVQVDYEGYVQAACEDLASLTGRDPFAVSFIPDPACNRYEVTCDDSPMGSTTIDTPGNSGYSPDGITTLPVLGGGGAAATVDITVAGGVITTAVLNAPGTGYTGTGLVDLSSLVFVPGTATTVTVTPLGCTALTVYDCAVGPTGEILQLGRFQPGETYHMCGLAEPTVPSDYSIVEDGNCLCNCTEMSLEETSGVGNIDYTYIACNGAVVPGNLGAGATIGPICMATGSLTYTLNASATVIVTTGAACDAV